MRLIVEKCTPKTIYYMLERIRRCNKKAISQKANDVIKEHFSHICEKKHDLRGIYCFVRRERNNDKVNDMNFYIQ